MAPRELLERASKLLALRIEHRKTREKAERALTEWCDDGEAVSRILTARFREEPGGRVGAHFRGSSSKPYSVSMERQGPADRPTAFLKPTCDCPSAKADAVCKHMVLLAMAYLSDRDSFAIGSENLEDLEDETKPARESPLALLGGAEIADDPMRGAPFALAYCKPSMGLWRDCKNCAGKPPRNGELVFLNQPSDEVYWRHVPCLTPTMINQVARELWPGEPDPRCDRIPGFDKLDDSERRLVGRVFSAANAKPLKRKAPKRGLGQ